MPDNLEIEQGWKEKKVSIEGITNKQSTSSQALVLEPPNDANRANIISVIIILVMIIPGIFFPPILLINIPLLYLRQAYRQYFYSRAYRWKFSFQCPDCNIVNSPIERRGRLPLTIRCTECRSRLKILEAN
jgi:hypothetical protein